MELHLENVEHFKECRLKSHFVSAVPQNILREKKKKNQIHIYCVKLDGGEQRV